MLLFLLISVPLLAQPPAIKEASGIVRSGNSLLIVDDSDVGAYYRVPLKKGLGPLIDLNSQKPERVKLKAHNLGIDLESIGILADTRIVLLSERLRSLVSDTGILAEYDSDLAEVGKRGLEGVAVRSKADGSSIVAVLWEGGYGDFSVTQYMRPPVGRGPWLPILLIHDVPRHGAAGRVRLRDVKTVELQVPMPMGKEPEAQRFRAPDLTWTKLPGGEWGFIVLLSSQNASAKPIFQHHWILRFDLNGKSVGEPLDLAAAVPPKTRDANWEGVNWFEPGKSLVVCHEGDSGLQPHAFILDLPPAWRF